MKMRENNHRARGLAALLSGIKTRLPIAAPLIFGLFLMADANAGLVSRDLSMPGDNQITYDIDTGLSWLDLTNTYRVSPADVLGGFGGYSTTLGYRYATEGEFLTLLTHAGITPGHSTSWDTTNINNTWTLINLLGITYSDGHTYLSNGVLKYSPPGDYRGGSLAVNDIGEYDAWTDSLSGLQGYYNSTGWGSLLVKERVAPVTVPSTIWLFAIGLFSLLGASSKLRIQYILSALLTSFTERFKIQPS